MSKAEKFIKDYTMHCSNELCAVEDRFGKKVLSYHEWLAPDQALRAVEIAREEIKSEIERLIKSYSPIQSSEGKYRVEAYKEVLDIINSNFLNISRSGNSHIGAMTETLRKKEIDEAANEYINGEPDGAQKVVSKVGFLFGAEWADEHPRVHHQLPVGNVWHDSNIEQPQLGSDIIVLQGKNGEVLNSTISVEPDRLWAYINDLLDLTKREEAMTDALRTEYEKGRADVLRVIDPDEMVADFYSQPLSKTRSLVSIYRQGIIDIVKRINNNEKTSITSTRSIDDGRVR